MPTGGARRGRRDNGLVAQEYAVVGDVDPRIGEHLLDVLAAVGVAAYLQPAADLHPVTRTTTLPARPTDRLYADRAHLATARDYLDQVIAAPEQLPAVSPEYAVGAESAASAESASGGDAAAGPEAKASDDDVFAQIVAGYHATVDPTRVPWPEAEDVETAGTAPVDMDTEPAPRTVIRRAYGVIDPGSILDGLDTFGADLPDEDDDEGYTPPPPPPLPHISAAAGVATLGIICGLALFFWPRFSPLPEGTTLFIAFAAVLSGFVALIWRLRPGTDEDDDDDNGARV